MDSKSLYQYSRNAIVMPEGLASQEVIAGLTLEHRGWLNGSKLLY